MPLLQTVQTTGLIRRPAESRRAADGLASASQQNAQSAAGARPTRIVPRQAPHLCLSAPALIAQGEVVMVGERFGVRFSEIVDPEKRVESL